MINSHSNTMLKGRALPLKSLFSYIFRTSPLKNPSGFKDIKYFIINNPPLSPTEKLRINTEKLTKFVLYSDSKIYPHY